MSTKPQADRTNKKTIGLMYALPASKERALAICDSGAIDGFGLYKLILTDPVLFCRAQALYGEYFGSQASAYNSISKIIIMLNSTTVKNYMLKFASPSKDEADEEKIIAEQKAIAAHSLAVAVSARFIAKQRGLGDAKYEQYYAAGLVHDLGKLLCGARGSHCEAGLAGAKEMKLDNSLRDVIAFHHDIDNYSGKYADILCTVAIADWFVYTRLDKRYSLGKAPKLSKSVWEKIKITDDELAPIEKIARAEIKKCESFLKAGA